jgi:hypothetical protein
VHGWSIEKSRPPVAGWINTLSPFLNRMRGSSHK